MPPDPPREADQSAKIIWPTKEEFDRGVTDLRRYIPVWKASLALLVIKPKLGLIVSLRQVETDERGFRIVLEVVEAMVAPPDFERQKPITLACVWNQPYLSFNVHDISAPYSFYLHFGSAGVQRAREMMVTLAGDTNNPFVLGRLRSCFNSRP
jgi:hypothetical protein